MACRENIFDFMHQKLGVPRDQCKAIWRPLFAQTNQSLKVKCTLLSFLPRLPAYYICQVSYQSNMTGRHTHTSVTQKASTSRVPSLLSINNDSHIYESMLQLGRHTHTFAAQRTSTSRVPSLLPLNSDSQMYDTMMGLGRHTHTMTLQLTAGPSCWWLSI